MSSDFSVTAATEASRLLSALKRLLKEQGKTYVDVAQALDLSEASVKRLFSGGSGAFSLERMGQVCALLNITFSEVVRFMEAEDLSASRVSRLSREQEKELVSDEKLLLVAVCSLNHWRLADIVGNYAIEEVECIALLLRLDRLGLIELLPGNRIRPKVARNFAWIKNGPIEQYFRANAQESFLRAPFDAPGEMMQFTFGMLSPGAIQSLNRSLKRLETEFLELHQHDRDLPISERYGVCLLLAMRGWKPDSFKQLQRDKQQEPAGTKITPGGKDDS